MGPLLRSYSVVYNEDVFRIDIESLLKLLAWPCSNFTMWWLGDRSRPGQHPGKFERLVHRSRSSCFIFISELFFSCTEETLTHARAHHRSSVLQQLHLDQIRWIVSSSSSTSTSRALRAARWMMARAWSRCALLSTSPPAEGGRRRSWRCFCSSTELGGQDAIKPLVTVNLHHLCFSLHDYYLISYIFLYTTSIS